LKLQDGNARNATAGEIIRSGTKFISVITRITTVYPMEAVNTLQNHPSAHMFKNLVKEKKVDATWIAPKI
jgi:hypothetical protein